MIKSSEVVKTDLKSLQLDRLKEYDEKMRDLGKAFSKMMAQVYLKDFIMAIDIVNDLQAKATQTLGVAERNLKYVEGVAFFERAIDYFEKHNIKDTAEARKRYVDIDPEVQEATELRDKSIAIVKYLNTKMQAYRMCHDDIKKVVYGDNFMTGYEGN